jgi:hypothetical protein
MVLHILQIIISYLRSSSWLIKNITFKKKQQLVPTDCVVFVFLNINMLKKEIYCYFVYKIDNFVIGNRSSYLEFF